MLTLRCMKSLITLLLALSLGAPISFDKTVHDFGQVSQNAGPLSCTFTVTNTSEEPLTVFAVVSSCGCTEVRWTRETIQPGGKGEITATYSNDEGPTYFDKTLTVYTSAQKKATVLHLKGVVKKNGTK